ncbi:MAG: hypothetical protein H7Z12_15905 [Rhodospirillaceae bacterium]|nr:hypothetical protein [Rhodospirillales bacterium]
MSHRIPSLLVLLGLVAGVVPAQACGRTDKDMGRSFPAVPLIATNTATGERKLMWNLMGVLHAQEAGYIMLSPYETGDRWDAAEKGENDTAQWWASPQPDAAHGGGAMKLRVTAKREGRTEIPLRYIPKQGVPDDVSFRVIVDPAEPPPEPPTLTVEGETFQGRVRDYRTFQIRLKTPLPPGYRWEVKEAVYLDWNTSNGDQWLPVDISASQGDDGLFFASTRGKSARIVFIQKRDGWQLFPDTVTLLLEVAPTPLC